MKPSKKSSIILATGNSHKTEEIRAYTEGLNLSLKDLTSYPEIGDIEETGKTFAENAFIKAKAVFNYTGLPSLADDSGLVVPALDGAPGVKSARYAGENSTSEMLIKKLLKNMAALNGERRNAFFQTTLCFINGQESPVYCEGKVFGHIAESPSGTEGFGYDPVFTPEGYDITFAEMDVKEKNKISHRARALSMFVEKYKLSLK